MRDPSLSDFGLTLPTKSSSLSSLQSGPNLRDILNIGAQTAETLGGIDRQLAAIRQPKSRLQQLLAALPAIAATGIAGAQGGLGAAGAVGLGALGGLEEVAAAEQEQKAAAIQSLQEQRDAALDKVEKAQQRVQGLLVAQPKLFIDPATGESAVDPEMLGLLATGFDLPLNPVSTQMLGERGDTWKRRHDYLVSRFEAAETPEDARVLAKAIFKNDGWANAPESVIDSVVNTAGKPEFNTTMANIIAQNTTNALDVFKFADENNLDYADAEVLRMAQWGRKDVSVDDVILSLIERYNMWASNPDNRETSAALRDQAGTDDVEFTRLQIKEAFKDEQGSANQLLKYFGILGDENTARILAFYKMESDKFDLASISGKVETMKLFRTMDEEARRRYIFNNALEANKAFEEQAFRSSATSTAVKINDVKTRLKDRVPDDVDIDGVANEIIKHARTRATRPDGKLDEELFKTELEKELAEAIRQLQD